MNCFKKLIYNIIGLGKGQKKIKWILPYIRGKDVLDIGCAGMKETSCDMDNYLHRHLAVNSKSCIGLDHNKEIATKLEKMGYKIITADAQNFILDYQFDTVVAADIIEHLEDVKGFFLSTTRVLKNNGYLIITTPNPWFFLRFIRCLVKGDGGVSPDHVMWFCRNSVTEILSRYGFRVEKIKFGSSESFFYHLFFLPPVLRHTSIFIAARKVCNVTL